MESKFLAEILGKGGYAATKSALEKFPQLQSVIVPRAVFSWVSVMADLGYDSELPGEPGSYLSLQKNEKDLYNGALVIKNELYAFEDADILHVAASVGVALGIQSDLTDDVKAKDLTKLGKSIDLLVKTEILKSLRSKKKPCGKCGKADYNDIRGNLGDCCLSKDEEGAVAAPAPPNPSDVPVKPAKPIDANRQVSSLGKKPVNKPNLAIGQGQSKFMIKKSELQSKCLDCEMPLFSNNKLTGCICIKEIVSLVKSEMVPEGLVLKYNKKDLDEDAVSALISIIKG